MTTIAGRMKLVTTRHMAASVTDLECVGWSMVSREILRHGESRKGCRWNT